MDSVSSPALTVYLTNARAGIVETIDVPAELPALARWLVKQHAEYRGRTGFYIKRRGEWLRVVISRGGQYQWGWQYTAAHLLPLFQRADRVAKLPRLKPVTRQRSAARKAG